MFDRRPWRLVGAFLLAGFLLAGCGGGGGGGSGSSSGSGSTSSTPGDTTGDSVPNDPPALATPSYVGKSGPATIGEYNAGAYAGEVMIMVNAAAGLTSGVPLTFPSDQESFSQTQSGPEGGTAVIQGRRRDDGTAWLSIEYSAYRQKDTDSGELVTLDGLAEFQFKATGNSVEMDLSQYELKSSSSDVTLNGSILKKQVTDPYNEVTTTYTENMVLFDKILQTYIKTGNLVAQLTHQEDVAVQGKLYDSRGGYVAIHSDYPLRYDSFDGVQTPYSGGPLRLSGATGGTTADLVVLNSNFASVGLDANGDGLAEESSRLDWSTLSPDLTATPNGAPEADLGPEVTGTAGEAIGLNGRYSHSQDGGFVHFAWTLASVPAGSNAVLENTSTANPTLDSDLPGDYLVRLEASNASGSSSDAMIVRSDDVSGHDSAAGPDAGPDREAVLGAQILLDARGSKAPSGNWGDYNWHLSTPDGSQAALNAPNAAEPTFTPDKAGYYYASLNSCCDSRASALINVGGPLHLGLQSSLADLAVQTIAIGDLNNDGLPDLVVDGDRASNAVLILYNRGGGRFSSPASFTIGIWQFAIGDLNGDGLADLVAESSSGINYRLQEPDGSLTTPVTVNGSADFGAIVIAKLGDASRNSIVTQSDYDYLTIYGPQSGGTVGNPVQLDFGSMIDAFAVGDVTGDGIADLLVIENSLSQLQVWPGLSDGTFGTEVVYPLSGDESSVTVGDINGDGRNDVLLWSSQRMSLRLQQPDGTLGTEQGLTSRGQTKVPVIADVNDDGRNDVVFPESFRNPVDGEPLNGIGTFIQQPDGSLSNEFIFPINANDTNHVLVADINNDGIADVVTTASINDGLRLALGKSSSGGVLSSKSLRSEPRRQPRKRWQHVNSTVVRPALPTIPMR